MKSLKMKSSNLFARPAAALAIFATTVLALSSFAVSQASSIPTGRLMQPEELAKILKDAHAPKPLMIQVGSHVLFQQAHIPGSEYIGAASSEAGVQQLRQRMDSVSKAQLVVLYCGCCPWSHCPNVKPAYDALASMGFTNLKVLYIANNFGTDWVDKGYPVAKGD